MDDFTKLNDFAEGALDSSEERELFGRLAASDNLRGELKRLMAVNSSINANRSLFAVPSASKAKVFAGIGFDSVSPALPASFASGIRGFLRSSRGKILGGIACAALGAALMLLFQGAPETKQEVTNSKNQVTMSNPPNALASREEVPQRNMEPLISVIRDTVVVIRYVTERVSSETNVSVAQNEEKQPEKEFVLMEPRESNFSNRPRTKPLLLGNNGENAIQNFLSGRVLSPEPQLCGDVSGMGLSLEVRGGQYWNMPEASLNPSKYSMFNNTSITVLYDISKHFSIGLDIRQETFFQRFDGEDIYSLPVTYEQQPNFTSYGIVFRYDSRSNKSIRPFYQGIVGANKIGLIGRASAGLAYSPYSDISFLLGLEYSYMGYAHQNKLFGSQKFGLNYGVSFKF